LQNQGCTPDGLMGTVLYPLSTSFLTILSESPLIAQMAFSRKNKAEQNLSAQQV